MTSLKTMLSAAAALALLVPMATPTASFGEGLRGGHGGGAAFHGNGGGAAFHGNGGGAAFHGNAGGNFHASTGSNFRANTAGVRAGGTAPTANFAANAQAGRPTGGTWNGGRTGWTGGGDRTAWNGGRGEWRGDRDRGGRWWPGVAAGAAIGGAIAAGDAYAYYGGPDYYDYSDDYGYDGVAAVPVPVGGDSVAYCEQRYRSYDPASGTYLGFDGLRHPCP